MLVWTTRDGVEIPIDQMATPHLRNTINHISRRQRELTSLYLSTIIFLQGELSQETIADERAQKLERLEEMKQAMRSELQKRTTNV